MRTPIVLAVVLLAGAALAGCASNNTTTTPSTTTTTPTTTSTPTASTTPTVSTPTTPTLPAVTATITSVEVIAAPDRAASGSDANVCWRVEGTGHIPHTALHYDSASHPDATSFADYKGGAVYPGGASAADPKGYDLPGVFCAPIKAADGPVYYRAHALNPPALPGTLSPERALWSGAGPSGLDFVGDIPELASAGTNVTVCWQDDSIGHVPHTAVHWDTVSHPNSTNFADYKGGAVYPDNQTAAVAAGYDTPGPFCSNVKMPASGAIYFRAHELIPGSINNLSHERSIVVAPAVSIASAAATAAANGNVLVCWRAEVETGTASHVPHTAVHWDTTSHPQSTNFADYKGGAVYPDNQTAAVAAGYDLPGPFCSNVKMPASGTLYFRAHVLVPGARNELSDEIAIPVSG